MISRSFSLSPGGVFSGYPRRDARNTAHAAAPFASRTGFRLALRDVSDPRGPESTLGSAPRLSNAPSADPAETLATREDPRTEKIRVDEPEPPGVSEPRVSRRVLSSPRASARSVSRNARASLGRRKSAASAASGTSRPSTASSFALAAYANAARKTSSHARLALGETTHMSSMSSSKRATLASAAGAYFTSYAAMLLLAPLLPLQRRLLLHNLQDEQAPWQREVHDDSA
mgnify:CR=1 FL=1